MSLDDLRKHIHIIDECILMLLSQRALLVDQVAREKVKHGIDSLDQSVADQKEFKLVQKGLDLGLNPEFVRKLWHLIHQESLSQQNNLFRN